MEYNNNETGLWIGQTIVPPIFVDPFTERFNVTPKEDTVVIIEKANNKVNSIDSIAADSSMAIQEVREAVARQIKKSIKPNK